MKKLVTLIMIITMLVLNVSPAYAAKDTKAPTVTKTNPAGNTSDIMVETSIIVRLSEKIQKGKNFTKITLTEMESKTVECTATIDGNLLVITPNKNLSYQTYYTVTIPAAAVKDKAGNNLKKAYSYDFLTEVDPTATATPEDETGVYQYKLNMEATLDHELTEKELEYFTGLLDMLGIKAKFTSFMRVEEK